MDSYSKTKVGPTAAQGIATKAVAFSLLEVLIVIALLGLVVGIAMPTLFLRSGEQATFQSFSQAIDNARFFSLLHNEPVRLTIDLAKQEVSFTFENGGLWSVSKELPKYKFDKVKLEAIWLTNRFTSAGIVETSVFPTGAIQPLRLIWSSGNDRYDFAVRDFLGEIAYGPSNGIFY